MKNKNRLLLFDGDYLLFSVLRAVETEIQWSKEVWTLHINELEARNALSGTIKKQVKAVGGGQPVLCFGAASFRRDLDPTYKAQRKDIRLPMLFKQLHRELRTGQGDWPATFKWGIEGDDVMGILATKPGNEGAIIVSEDKDMLQIPGLLYRQGKLSKISLEEADQHHLYQTLVGDVADGYRGCPKVGPKTAKKYLKDGWQGILEAFAKAKLSSDDALLQARLARILRWTEWDANEQKPRLWSPPQS